MTLDEAQRILGLGPDEDPVPHLEDFIAARERIAEMVRSAPNQTLADRYQSGLTEFDQALAVLRECSGRFASATPAPTTAPGPVITPAIVPVASVSTPAPIVVASVPHHAPVIESVPAPKPVVTVISTHQPIAPTTIASSNPTPPPAPAPVFPPQGPLAPEVPPVVPTPTPSQTPTPATIPVTPEILKTPPSVPVVIPEEAPAVPDIAPTQGLPIDISSPTKKAEISAAVAAAIIPPVRPSSKKSGSSKFLVVSLILLLLAVAGGYAFLRFEDEKRLNRLAQLTDLEKEGAAMIEAHRWPEAKAIADKIHAIDPAAEAATTLRRNIATGTEEEDHQFLQYWHGEALAAFESNRPDDAAKAIDQILSKAPADPEALELRGKIEAARSAEKLRLTLADIRKKIETHEWDAAVTTSAALLNQIPDQAEAKTLLAEATAGRDKQLADLAKSRELYAEAKLHDNGAYDAAGITAIRQAALLAPKDPDIKALLEKLSSYTRTLRVPGDFSTLAEALADAHDRDRIVLAEGEWHGPFVVNAAVQIQGAGSDKTLLTCPAAAGAAITFGPLAKGARITGITFKHTSLDPSAERFSAALIRNGSVEFADCHFTEAAGHGLAIISGGRATATKCRFTHNGWDGASVSGAGSAMEISDCDSNHNIEHGFDVWDSATATLTNNRCDGNSRNGILIDANAAPVSLTGNQLRNNREFGIVLARSGTGTVTGNTMTANLMGGLVIRLAADKLQVQGNQIQSDAAPGLALEKGLSKAPYAGNEITSANPANPTVMENIDFNAKPATTAPTDEIPPVIEANPPKALPVPKKKK